MSNSEDNTWFYESKNTSNGNDLSNIYKRPSPRVNVPEEESTDSFLVNERKLERLEEIMQGELREALAAIGIAQRKVYSYISSQLPLDANDDGRDLLPYCQIIEHHEPEMLQFRFEGFLPPYFEVNELPKEILRERYRGWNKEYYILVTRQAVKRLKIKQTFHEKAFLLIVHCFPNNLERDLDNRNRKYLIDALKLSGILLNDSWQDVSIMEIGCLDQEAGAHVEVFVSKDKNKIEVIREAERMFYSLGNL
ncbi:hypothetical protein LJR153_007391 [Paenibacillus sp. LjRoot153]|uniref:hypothetical protein n=1 Tax=Paenibacillus sp. LjRoot153 TaxID=3342270 RepID=UPI003ECC9432